MAGPRKHTAAALRKVRVIRNPFQVGDRVVIQFNEKLIFYGTVTFAQRTGWSQSDMCYRVHLDNDSELELASYGMRKNMRKLTAMEQLADAAE